MSSTRRILSSQANGARSRGPRTAEGKARSARNATRHGLLSKTVVLETESAENFKLLVSQYLQRFGPVDAVEFGMIEEMAAFYWRIRRAWAIETRMLEESIRNQTVGDEVVRLAHGFRELGASHDLDLVHRYETSLHRMYQRALYNLLLLRDTPSPAEPDSNFMERPIPVPASSEEAPAEPVETPAAAPDEAPTTPKLRNEPNPISEHPPLPAPPPPPAAPKLRIEPSSIFGQQPSRNANAMSAAPVSRPEAPPRLLGIAAMGAGIKSDAATAGLPAVTMDTSD